MPVPPSKEKSHSIIYVTEGIYDFQKGNQNYKVLPNELIIIPAGEVFSVKKIINGLKGYTIHFSPEYFIDSTSAVGVLNSFDFLLPFTNSYFSQISDRSLFLRLFERLNALYQENNKENKRMITTYILALLYELKRDYGNKPLTSTTYEALSHAFKQTLFQNFKKLHRTSEYASLLRITPNHLNKALKAATNKSPKQWINETLILEAKYLLHNTELNINEVALELGINDPSYFSRLFKKMTDVSPSMYVRMIEKS